MEILSSARQEMFWIWFTISPAISPAGFLLQRRCLVIFGCGCWETAKEQRRAFWELASSPTCRRQVDFGVLWCHVLARFSKLQRSWFLYEWRGLMPSMSFANSLRDLIVRSGKLGHLEFRSDHTFFLSIFVVIFDACFMLPNPLKMVRWVDIRFGGTPPIL